MLKTIDLPLPGVYLYESKHKEGDVVHGHYHNIHQILYALEGDGMITLDGEQFHVEEDNALFIVPHSRHSVISDSKLILLVLAFDEERVDANTLEGLLSVSFSSSCFIKLNPLEASIVRPLLRKMLFEQANQDKLYSWAIRIYLLEILLVLAKSYQPSNAIDTNSLRAEWIRDYIDKHYFEKLTADDIGARLGISARYVNTIFKEKYQITPMQHLAGVRIDLAKKMLMETNKDIISIGFEVGYETLSTFYRNFNNAVKTTPSHFRQHHRFL